MKNISDIKCGLAVKEKRNLPENEDFFLDVMLCTPVKIYRPF
jgi:hypothetical protein